jgi:hypothetical protein
VNEASLRDRQDDVRGLLVLIDDETRVNGAHGDFLKNAAVDSVAGGIPPARAGGAFICQTWGLRGVLPAGVVAIRLTRSRIRGTEWGSRVARHEVRTAARIDSGVWPSGSGSARTISPATSSPVTALGRP